MIDLALNAKGDLLFVKPDSKIKPLKVSFYLAKKKAIKIDFLIDDSNKIEGSSNSLSMKFNVDDKISKASPLILSDNMAKIQSIKIRLATALGEIKGDPTIGSRLELARHKEIYLESVINEIIQTVKESISDVLPSAEVKAKPVIKKNNTYKQCVEIYIYNEGYLIFKYDI